VGRIRRYLVEADSHDNEVEQQVSRDYEHRDADRLLEALEEYRAEQPQEHEGDEHLLVVEEPRHQRVLGEVDRRV
jgi:hypothetical protein